MSNHTSALPVAPVVSYKPDRKLVLGALCGMIAAASWGSSFGLARAGTLAGMGPLDFIVLRLLPGAVLALPLVLRRSFLTSGEFVASRAVLLSLCIGPPFVALASGGYLFAPLAHGAVLQPGTMTLSSLVIATLFFGDRLTLQRLAGALAVICGLVLVAGSGIAHAGPQSLIGDAMFASAGLLWATYTALIRRWNISALGGTAMALVVAGIITLPLALASGTFTHLTQFPLSLVLAQLAVQGVISGFLGILFYGWSIRLIGASRATLFAAIVPVVAILLGIPVAGEWPDPAQWLGVGIVTSGLLLGLGVLDPLFRHASPPA